MIHLGIDVGIETVFVGLHHVTAARRLLVDETDAHDTLDALEAILPGNDKPDRCAVLVGQDLTVDSDREYRQRVGRLGDGKALTIWPDYRTVALARHSCRVVQGLKSDVPGLGRWLQAFDHCFQRYTHPRDNHRPGFDAAQAIDSLLEIKRFDEVVKIEGAGLLGVTIHGNLPGPRIEILGVHVWIRFAGAKLVVVVVGRDGLVVVGRLAGTELAGPDVLEHRAPLVRDNRAESRTRRSERTGNASRANKIAAIQIVFLARDFRRANIGGLLDQHPGYLAWSLASIDPL